MTTLKVLLTSSALLLSAIGIFGIVSQVVASRSQEFAKVLEAVAE